MADISENKLLLVLIAIFVSPLAVFLRVGLGLHFWINLILYLGTIGTVTFLDFPYIGLVTMLHAWIVIFK